MYVDMHFWIDLCIVIEYANGRHDLEKGLLHNLMSMGLLGQMDRFGFVCLF